jgi:hypothetical protein
MVHFNYYFDGPCGDCPKSLTLECDTETCIHWLAWEEVERTIKELQEG